MIEFRDVTKLYRTPRRTLDRFIVVFTSNGMKKQQTTNVYLNVCHLCSTVVFVKFIYIICSNNKHVSPQFTCKMRQNDAATD